MPQSRRSGRQELPKARDADSIDARARPMANMEFRTNPLESCPKCGGPSYPSVDRSGEDYYWCPSCHSYFVPDRDREQWRHELPKPQDTDSIDARARQWGFTDIMGETDDPLFPGGVTGPNDLEPVREAMVDEGPDARKRYADLFRTLFTKKIPTLDDIEKLIDGIESGDTNATNAARILLGMGPEGSGPPIPAGGVPPGPDVGGSHLPYINTGGAMPPEPMGAGDMPDPGAGLV